MKAFPYLKKVQAGFVGIASEDTLPPGPIFFPKQVHGDEVLILESKAQFATLNGKEADAVITSVSEMAVGIKTADCVPILLAHPKGVVAAVHAGWRGSALKILSKTLALMQKHYQLDVGEIHLAIGPAICGACYEVGREVIEAFQDDFYDHDKMIQPRGEKFLLDLVDINVQQALAAGIAAKNIRIDSRCTYESEEFYSYRRLQKEGVSTEGRNVAWVSVSE